MGCGEETVARTLAGISKVLRGSPGILLSVPNKSVEEFHQRLLAEDSNDRPNERG
jgi:hypothetical protein